MHMWLRYAHCLSSVLMARTVRECEAQQASAHGRPSFEGRFAITTQVDAMTSLVRERDESDREVITPQNVVALTPCNKSRFHVLS